MVKRLLTFAVVCGVILVLLAILLPALTRVDAPTYYRSICANNLKQLGLSLKMYAHETPQEMYPPLSPEPGRLMWITAVFPEYTSDLDVYVCRLDEDLEYVRELYDRYIHRRSDMAESIDDWSYFYLSYALFDDKDVATFADHYKARMAAGEPVDGDIPLSKYRELDPAIFEGCSSPPPSTAAGRALGRDRLYRLRLDLERNFLPGQDDRAESMLSPSTCLQPHIPVLIERPENHEPIGGNVLYLDGHVEFIPYPGKWPMTEKTIGILRELDALGDD